MPAALVVSQLVKSYKGWFGAPQLALKGLSLSIPRGVAFGLIGPNGAGKTTFIKLLLGVVRPTSGEVTVLDGDPQDTRVRARIGYLPERMHLPTALRARDFLSSVATLKGLREVDLAPLLARVGLKDSSQRIGNFSKGMRQRLGLAAAMLGQPDLLILDEPTDGIDPVGRVEVRQLLLDEKARGATILLNSHLLSETERVCDRIGVLDHGVLKLEGSLDEVRKKSSRWEVRFADGADATALEGAGFLRREGEWLFDGDTDAVNEAVDVVRRAGVRVVLLRPETRDLEAVLTNL